MLVDINLLPQKEKKNFKFIIMITVLAALLIAATFYYFFEINAVKRTTASIENEIKQTRALEAKLQKQLGNPAAKNSVTQLKTAIKWAADNRIETIPVMNDLTSLLPERGFIQTFSYQDSGTIALSVQFDTSTEAAAYLASLNHSAWVTSAVLTSLNTASINNSGTASGSQTNSAIIDSLTGASILGSDTPNTGTNSGVGADAQTQYLPRYIGQFTIQLNQDYLKKNIAQSKMSSSNTDGVSGS